VLGCPVLMPTRPQPAFIDETRQIEASDPEEFDRVAFTLSAVRALGPRPITVAVYRRQAGLRVDSVRDWRRGAGALWVMLGVPARASRAQIAHALAEVAGITELPFAMDVLVNAGRDVV
jgi:hypothetical protein